MSNSTIFISYSHNDEREKEALLSHLGVLRETYPIELWSDERIEGGGDWATEIREAINRARVVILLITAHFLTSPFILSQEVPPLLSRRKSEGVAVIPVIARMCAWQEVKWLSQMSVRPKNGRPVWGDGGNHMDEDLTAIAREVVSILVKNVKEANGSIRVLVADDHIHAVEGLSYIIRQERDMNVVGQADTIMQVLEQTKRTQPDVIVLDLAWPGDREAGIHIIPQLRDSCPTMKIVAITNYPELLEDARRAGAFPLRKGFSRVELLDTIRYAVRASPVLPNPTNQRAALIEQLTERERGVLPMLGLTDKTIAQQLGIAEGTVKKHVSSILTKLGAQSRTEAAILAERLKLVQRPSLTDLYQLLIQHFDEEELRALCFSLGIAYDDLPAVGKIAKARELMTYLERRGRVGELVVLCARQRPHVIWPKPE